RPAPLRPATKLNGQVPEAVAAVLTRALAQLPDERPATATEMRRALRAAVQSQAPDYYDTTTSVDGLWMESGLLGEDLAAASFGATKSSISEVTNAGRIVAPSPAPGVDEQGAAFAWFRLGGARTVYIALCLLLLVIAALAYWRLNPLSGSSAANPPVGETVIARPDGSTPAPRPFEAMRYYLEVESESGRAESVAGDNPVVRGRFLKFHFTPIRSGYLYIIAPGKRRGLALLLTAEPNSAWSVKDSGLEGGTAYSFPPGQNKWIQVASGASSRIYPIIFASDPLVQPRFLAGPVDRALTAAEEHELDKLQKRFGQGVRVEAQDTESIVVIPAERVSGEA